MAGAGVDEFDTNNAVAAAAVFGNGEADVVKFGRGDVVAGGSGDVVGSGGGAVVVVDFGLQKPSQSGFLIGNCERL